MAYLKDWEGSIMKRQGFNEQEKKKMMLPQETGDGIYITGIHWKIFLVYNTKVARVMKTQVY